MLKTFVEEAAALTSIVLFVGMIAVWAQLIPQLQPKGQGTRAGGRPLGISGTAGDNFAFRVDSPGARHHH